MISLLLQVELGVMDRVQSVSIQMCDVQKHKSYLFFAIWV